MAEMLHVRIVNDRSMVPTSTLRWLGRDLVRASGEFIRERCHRQCHGGPFCIENSLSGDSSGRIITKSACACMEVAPGDALTFVGAEATVAPEQERHLECGVGFRPRGWGLEHAPGAAALKHAGGKAKHRMPWAQRFVTLD